MTSTKARFALHYFEMVVAMVAGMIALGPAWAAAVPSLEDHPAAAAMVMATNMSIGMAAWMLVRKHSWGHIAGMCAAMFVPFVALLIPYGLGLISGGTLMMAGHILMFPAMLIAMLRRQGARPAPRPRARPR
ncbi:hypothetical protein AB0J83_17715 [Actinoplanes sp. NPDC049596]|uniref:hypothetical protein n=1 Tax=unclassified Actinoplanes TaxID=2626549 RepID=UPI0034349165